MNFILLKTDGTKELITTDKLTLSDMYEKIGCSMIDMPQISNDGLTAICDDEGLCVDEPVFNPFLRCFGNPYIAGNVILCRINYDGDTCGLSGSEVSKILTDSKWVNHYSM